MDDVGPSLCRELKILFIVISINISSLVERGLAMVETFYFGGVGCANSESSTAIFLLISVNVRVQLS